MKNVASYAGIMKIISRLPSSSNGNPRYLICVGGKKCKTQVDHQHGYAVPNYDGKTVEATIGTHYGSATLNTIKAV